MYLADRILFDKKLAETMSALAWYCIHPADPSLIDALVRVNEIQQYFIGQMIGARSSNTYLFFNALYRSAKTSIKYLGPGGCMQCFAIILRLFYYLLVKYIWALHAGQNSRAPISIFTDSMPSILAARFCLTAGNYMTVYSEKNTRE